MSTQDPMGTQGQPARGTGTGTSPGGTTGQGAESVRQYVPRPSPGYDDARAGDARAGPAPGGLAKGLTLLAAVTLMLSGTWNFLEGLGAIVKGGFYVVLPGYAFNVSVATWGWWHLIMGAVVFAVGACLLMDMLWARVAGVVVASLSAVINFLYIPYQPVWSVTVIAIDVFVMWALLAPRKRYA